MDVGSSSRPDIRDRKVKAYSAFFPVYSDSGYAAAIGIARAGYFCFSTQLCSEPANTLSAITCGRRGKRAGEYEQGSNQSKQKRMKDFFHSWSFRYSDFLTDSISFDDFLSLPVS
jgi:hypothetical protein